MAAFVGPYSTAEYTAFNKLPGSLQPGKVYHVTTTHTHPAGDAGTGTISLLVLPRGKVKLLSTSTVASSELAASATISIGNAAYQEAGSTWAPAAVASLLAATAADAGGIAESLPEVTVNSKSGVAITATVAAGDIEEGDTITLVVDFVILL